MISVEEALSRITDAFAPLPSEWVGLSQARGRVLAKDLLAPRDQPHQDISAMDGYAVRAADLESGSATLTMVGMAPAGGRFEGHVEPGQSPTSSTGSWATAPSPIAGSTPPRSSASSCATRSASARTTSPPRRTSAIRQAPRRRWSS
jgi:hypothetical protein